MKELGTPPGEGRNQDIEGELAGVLSPGRKSAGMSQ